MAPAEPQEIVAQGLGQIAHLAIGLDPERAVALRQFGAVGAVDQRQVGEFGDRPVERLVDLGLAEGVVQVVVAADHMGDRHVVVVDHHREIVGRAAVGAQDDQIVELAIGDRDLALDPVVDRRRALLRRLEADHRRHARRCGGRVAVAPGAVIAHRALFGARLLAHRLELGRRAIAVIGAAGGQQLPRDFGVALGAGGLVDDLAVPVEAEPSRPVDDRRHRLLCRAHPVGVLDAQPERAAVMARVEPVEQRGARPADMQKPGRRRREADGGRSLPKDGECESRYQRLRVRGQNSLVARVEQRGRARILLTAHSLATPAEAGAHASTARVGNSLCHCLKFRAAEEWVPAGAGKR